MITIGLIREEKTPSDNRVALTPHQCVDVQQQLPVKIIVQPAENRCFQDSEYAARGIEVNEDLSDCDILLGIKEVPPERLLEHKTYLFFSHTVKKQPYNQRLMQELIRKNIRMIDYEKLTHADGRRILGFGFFAGVVGAHNALLTYGKKYSAYTLKPAHDCLHYEDMVAQYHRIRIPSLKMIVTGSGQVSAGATEIMRRAGIDYAAPETFLQEQYNRPVYTHLKGDSLYARKDDKSYHRDDFHEHPEQYDCLFSLYLSITDILINGIYWNNRIPRLFEMSDTCHNDFRLKVIADVTCDIGGSVPINLRASTISDPVYGVKKCSGEITYPFQPTGEIIDLMAVDNLPNELPHDASGTFGEILSNTILPLFLENPKNPIIQRATICENGRLTSNYEYLSDYAYDNAQDVR